MSASGSHCCHGTPPEERSIGAMREGRPRTRGNWNCSHHCRAKCSRRTRMLRRRQSRPSRKTTQPNAGNGSLGEKSVLDRAINWIWAYVWVYMAVCGPRSERVSANFPVLQGGYREFLVINRDASCLPEVHLYFQWVRPYVHYPTSENTTDLSSEKTQPLTIALPGNQSLQNTSTQLKGPRYGGSFLLGPSFCSRN